VGLDRPHYFCPVGLACGALPGAEHAAGLGSAGRAGCPPVRARSGANHPQSICTPLARVGSTVTRGAERGLDRQEPSGIRRSLADRNCARVLRGARAGAHDRRLPSDGSSSTGRGRASPGYGDQRIVTRLLRSPRTPAAIPSIGSDRPDDQLRRLSVPASSALSGVPTTPQHRSSARIGHSTDVSRACPTPGGLTAAMTNTQRPSAMPYPRSSMVPAILPGASYHCSISRGRTSKGQLYLIAHALTLTASQANRLFTHSSWHQRLPVLYRHDWHHPHRRLGGQEFIKTRVHVSTISSRSGE